MRGSLSSLLRLRLVTASLLWLSLWFAPPTVAQEPAVPPSAAATSPNTETSASERPTLEVIITGLDELPEVRENVELLLQINRFDGQPAPLETRLRWLFSNAERDINRAMQPFGYYRPRIEKQLTTEGEGIEARFTITPNDPITVAEVAAEIRGEGRANPDYQKALRSLPKSGEPLVHSRYEAVKSRLGEISIAQGYFDAALQQSQIRVNLADYRADIELIYDTGPRYRFGAVAFEQKRTDADLSTPEIALEEGLLQRFLTFEAGEPYTSSALIELQRRLIGSNYFDSVTVDANPDEAQTVSPDSVVTPTFTEAPAAAANASPPAAAEAALAEQKRLPVTVHLVPNTRTRYSVALGYGTANGPQGTLEANRPLWNRFGHHFRLQLLASLNRFGFAGEYAIPGSDPVNDRYLLRSRASREVVGDKDTLKGSVGVGVRWIDGPWTQTYALDYEVESFRLPDEPRQLSQLLLPSGQLTYLNSRGDITRRQGYRADFFLRGSEGFLLSDVSFIQGEIALKAVHSFWRRGFWIARTQFGATYTPNFDDLPTSFRYFTGGDTTVRGYALDSIGPENDSGDVIGGRYLLVGSLEYEHRILENWGVAVFADTGSAFNDAPEFVIGAGLGVRYYSPLGPVRVDFAHGFDEDKGEIITFSFGIGPVL